MAESSSSSSSPSYISMDVVRLNSTAVTFLQQGNTKDAVDFLLQGLTDLASLNQQTEIPLERMFASPCGNNETNRSSNQQTLAGAGNSHDHQVHQQQQHQQQQQFQHATRVTTIASPLTTVVYNGAFFLEKHFSTTLKAAVMFYNTGLAYHRQGLQIPDSKSLTVALRLYQRSYALTSGVDTDDSAVLLVSALCNNMIQLHSEFFHIQEARQWRKILNEFLKWKGQFCLKSQDLNFFYTSLFYSLADDFSLAPAA